MTVVLDASAIIALVTADAAIGSHVQEATRVITPDLAISETLNVRYKYRHAGLPAPDLERLIEIFDRIEVLPSREFAFEADLLSAKLDHPAYDCLYAAMAKLKRGRLLTADRRFARKVRGHAIDVLVFTAEID